MVPNLRIGSSWVVNQATSYLLTSLHLGQESQDSRRRWRRRRRRLYEMTMKQSLSSRRCRKRWGRCWIARINGLRAPESWWAGLGCVCDTGDEKMPFIITRICKKKPREKKEKGERERERERETETDRQTYRQTRRQKCHRKRMRISPEGSNDRKGFVLIWSMTLGSMKVLDLWLTSFAFSLRDVDVD